MKVKTTYAKVIIFLFLLIIALLLDKQIRSNEDLRLTTNGTGLINISPTDDTYATYQDSARFTNGTNTIFSCSSVSI